MPTKKWYVNNRERQREYNRAYYQRHRAGLIEYARIYYAQHHDVLREKSRLYEAANSEKRLAAKRALASKQRVLHISWRDRHPEEDKAQRKRHYQANKERIAAQVQQYRANNQTSVHEWGRNNHNKRRALKYKSLAPLTHVQWSAIKVAYNGKCAYCGEKPRMLTQDHLIPLVRGGQHTIANIVPACMLCNQKKHDNPPPKGAELKVMMI